MNPMNRGHPPICRFGQNCHKNAQGMCRFYHPPQQQGQQGQGNRMGGQGFNPNSNGPTGQNYPQGKFPNNQGNSNQGGGNTSWGSQHGNWGKQPYQPSNTNPNHNNQNPNFNNSNPNFNNPNIPPKGDQFTNKFCNIYQYRQPCKYQGKCNRIHGYDQQQKIRRIAFSNQIPPVQPSKLGKFVNDGQTYLILRMDKGVSILTFNQQTSQFAIAKTWQFPKQQYNYSFYSQKQNFIYFAAQNPKNFLYEIGIYDMLTGNVVTIVQAHQSPVTDVIHFSNDIVLSSSKDGKINVWKIQGNNATLDQASSDHLFKTYSLGKNVQILFLDLSYVNGLKVLSAGTNDNRVLFYLGDQMQYNPLALAQKHAQTFKIRYCTLNDVSVAFVITWTKDSSSSSVIAINLSDFSVSEVVTHDAKQNPRNNIYLIEVVQEKLFIANMQGTITLYSLPVINKMGVMLHKNPVNSIVPSEYITKTNIKIPQMFVLQSKYHQKPGSIAVFTIKI